MTRNGPGRAPHRPAAGRGRPATLLRGLGIGLTAALLGLAPLAAAGQATPQRPAESVNPAPRLPEWTYADLADWSDGTPMVLRAKVRSMVPVEPARSPGLRPGQARFYVEARTMALIAGPPQAGDSLRYLVDLPLDAKGKPPRRPKGDVILFARSAGASAGAGHARAGGPAAGSSVAGTPSAASPSGRPGELQLVAPDAQIAWTAETEARLKGVLGELLAPGAPPRVTAVREAIHVPGNLAGEGETQLFLATGDGEPASITVVHRPGASPRWSVSFSEVLDSAGEPPAHDTLTWYRLACFLPARLAPAAHVSASPADRARADADYALVLNELGPCPRNRH